MNKPAKLTTHVLDTAHGCPAGGMKIELWRLNGRKPQLIVATTTNADGRTAAPLLDAAVMKSGNYEILFFVGDYFAGKSPSRSKAPFLDQVPVRFHLADPEASYHVPLLCTPWSYSTYRGS